MQNKTMGPRNLSFVLSEASGKRSVDTVTIASGEGVLEPGSVLGEVTASEKFVFSPNAEVVGKEGAETATAILCYRIDATDEDQQAVVFNADGEVKTPMLLFHSSVDDATKTATKLDQLRAAGIKAR